MIWVPAYAIYYLAAKAKGSIMEVGNPLEHTTFQLLKDKKDNYYQKLHYSTKKIVMLFVAFPSRLVSG